KLHLAGMTNQDIRRLEVPMNHRLLMSVRHRFQNAKKQPDASPDVQLVAIAIAVDVIAVDVLEHQIGLTSGGNPRIQKPRDVRVRQSAENAAFAAEPMLAN